MCGITGYYGVNDGTIIKQMVNKLQNRGPDNIDVANTDFGSIASARLSIIDVEGGNQPIWNEDETIAIVANCEIYNFISLREILISCGHEFRTKSDAEVVLHGYEEWGLDVASKIDGIYAIAIIDVKTKSLTLIRDRLGIKPLFYTLNHGILIFGSEIKAILEFPEIKKKLDRNILGTMIQLGYTIGEKTLFKNIYSLKPSHVLYYDEDGMKINQYWELPKLNKKQELDLDYLDQLLGEAVESQLISERPIGVFLSGGLDSSIVAMYASKYSKEISAFTQSFGEIDETPYAIKLAEHLGIEIHTVEHTIEKEIELSEKLIYAMESPTFGLSHTYTLAKFAKSKGKVVILSGLGGDELFGGYAQHKNALRISHIPSIGKISKIPSKISELVGLNKLARISRMSGDTNSRLQGLKLAIPPDETEKIIIPNGASTELDWSNIFEYEENQNFFRTVETELIYGQLEGNYLKIADRMSMAASLEMRVPLLDTRLLNYAMTLPSKYKINENMSKYALRKLVKGKLPNEIIDRGDEPKNKGSYIFSPVDFWNKGMKDHVSEKLSKDSVRDHGIFNFDWIQKEIKNANSFAKIRILWTLAATHDFVDLFDFEIPRI